MMDMQRHWTSAIEEAGGAVDEHSSDSRIIALIAGARLEIGTTGSSAQALTWLATDAPGSAGLRLAVSRSDSYPFREAFTIASGDRAFDDVFTIKTNDAPFARLWLDGHVREQLSAGPGYHFLLEDERTRAWRFASAEDEDHGDRVSVIRALTALGHRGRTLQREWSQLADQLGGRVIVHDPVIRADGALSIQVQLVHEIAEIDAFLGGLARRRPGRGLFTRVRCPRRGSHHDQYALHDASGRRHLRPRLTAETTAVRPESEALAARYQLECERPDLVHARLDDDLNQRLLAAAPSVVVAEPTQVTVMFLDLVLDAERLRAGIGLCERLALEDVERGLSSPYR